MFKRLGRFLVSIDRAVERADQERIDRYFGQLRGVANLDVEARTRELAIAALLESVMESCGNLVHRAIRAKSVAVSPRIE